MTLQGLKLRTDSEAAKAVLNTYSESGTLNQFLADKNKKHQQSGQLNMCQAAGPNENG